MSKSNAFETSLLALVFQNADIPNIGDAEGLRGSVAAGQLFLSLHTADPGEAGTQATSEISYDDYARQGLARNASNFPVADGVMSLGVNVDFPEMKSGAGGTVTHWSVGVASTGSTVVLYKGSVTPSILVATGSIPRIKGTPSGTPSTVSED